MSFSFLKTFNAHSISIKRVSVLLFILITIKANSQQTFIYGYVRDSVTHFPIEGATVSNITSKTKAITNDKGFFTLKASAADFFLRRLNRTSSIQESFRFR